MKININGYKESDIVWDVIDDLSYTDITDYEKTKEELLSRFEESYKQILDLQESNKMANAL